MPRDWDAATVEGARAAGIRAVHFDPYGLCSLDAHEHITELAAIVA